MGIPEQLQIIQENIARYATAPKVTLVAVSKYATVEQVQEAYAAGVRNFGENKVQDALAKMDALPLDGVHWHFIGSLQTNKVNKTVNRFRCIHTVDSFRLAEALSHANQKENFRQPVLIQVNSTDDPTRHGVQPEQVRPLTEQILALPGISLQGFMTLAPSEASLNGHVLILERIFGGLRELRDRIASEFAITLPELSMGMSHDYVHALKCGATIIRIGNVLFKN